MMVEVRENMYIVSNLGNLEHNKLRPERFMLSEPKQ
jgi:hypothetical protein